MPTKPKPMPKPAPRPAPAPSPKPTPAPAPSPAPAPQPTVSPAPKPITDSKPYAGLTPWQQARIAFMRFGLGPKVASAAKLASLDGAAYEACLREISNPQAIAIPDAQVVYKWKPNPARPGEPAKPDAVLDYANCCRFGLFMASAPLQPLPTDVMQTELSQRFAKSIEPEVGFAERLVYFWSNHFSTCQRKGGLVQATLGHFERSVIRRYALGKFSDMLKAVYQHPTMIAYLENEFSTGPNSYYGKSAYAKAKGISYNENLAREILELHTLGAYGGYTQADVISLAKALTGWSYQYASNSPNLGQFTFLPERHEPGPQTVLGVAYAQAGMDQALAILDALARHPSTAQHIAFKLIKHFITDSPTQRQVDTLAAVFTSSGGDLRAVARALLSIEGAWDPKMNRIVQPLQWQLSILRGLGFTRDSVLSKSSGFFSYSLTLNQQVWSRVTPDGYPDDDYYWKNTDFIRIRKDIAWGIVIAALITDKMVIDPDALAASLLPGVRSGALVTAMETLKKNRRYAGESLALLFSSPEYLLR